MSKCPHCKADVTMEDIGKEVKGYGLLKQEIMYYCPHCKAILGFSRGKWTG